MFKLLLSIKFVLIGMGVFAQDVYKEGDVIKNFSAPSILNHTAASADLVQLKSDITILDFFGTWCVPCIKALPELDKLKQKFPGKLQVLLISIEEQARLDKFLKARPGFTFPVIVDKETAITSLFNPPSYPYTVVMNARNKIIAITDAASITETDINKWLQGDVATPKTPAGPGKEKSEPIISIMNSKKLSSNALVALSQNFMYAAKSGDDTQSFEERMAALSMEELKIGLTNDNEKKAFWINAYNGFTQVLLKKNPDAYKDKKTFFTSNQILLAGAKFSLDDMEHGILRRNKVKWSLGYFSKLFPPKKEKELRVKKLDYRLHFALNCGAKSCPPIAFYNPEDIDRQLDVATAAYLNGEAIYNEKENRLGLPAIMGWFRRDFGGKKKMLLLVKKLGIVPEKANPRIHFNKYDWELALNNYIK